MKILLFGKNGQVGWELQRSLAPLGALVALDRQSQDYCGDLADLEGIARTVEQLRPDVVVNAAAYTAVDKAESEPQIAHRINADAPQALAQACARHGALLVHYSTDYVFPGTGERPWTEDDMPEPKSIYGQTKQAGERRVLRTVPRHLVFRTSWVYASRGSNFVRTMLRLAQEREQIRVVNDQTGAPTGAELIADVTAHAVAATVRSPALAGLYHLSAAGETNWHGYAEYVIATARRSPKGSAILTRKIEAVSSSDYPMAAPRPHNSRLDNHKLEQAFGLQLPPWRRGVERALAELGWAPGG